MVSAAPGKVCTATSPESTRVKVIASCAICVGWCVGAGVGFFVGTVVGVGVAACVGCAVGVGLLVEVLLLPPFATAAMTAMSPTKSTTAPQPIANLRPMWRFGC